LTEPSSSVALTGIPRELITFRSGGQEYGVDIAQVREIRSWTPATRLPRAPHFIVGVINLRGVVLPILDLGARLGLPLSEPSTRHVIMVIAQGTRLFGLLVDAVCDIVEVSEAAIQATPDTVNDEVRACVKGLFQVNERLIGLLAIDNVLPEPAAIAA
jgi:purine-binding chemotaxis protein CheW